MAYGHGAIACARAALAGGATWLAVATAAEAAELREDGIAAPLLVMGALTGAELDVAIEAGADVVAWTDDFLSAVEATRSTARVHVKLDTGMHRLGTPDPDVARRLVDRVAATEGLDLAGVMTHFATADEPESDFFGAQLEHFRPFAEEVKRAHPGCIVHAANSAAVLRSEAAHFDMARCGIAVYGMDPFGEDPSLRELEPALSLRSYVADVKELAAGESVGYGRSWSAPASTRVAVLPIGYGDGYRRGLSNAADVVIRGRRFPVVGTISMDNITVDVGDSRGRDRRLRDADRHRRRRARDRGGAGAHAGHDQLRDHVWRLGARAARASAALTTLAERLERAAPVRTVLGALPAVDAWLVGGTVRDALRGEFDLNEPDLVVAGDAEPRCARARREAGRVRVPLVGKVRCLACDRARPYVAV